MRLRIDADAGRHSRRELQHPPVVRRQGDAITFQGFGTRNPGSCIDYIYVSDGVRVLDFATHGDKRPGTDLYPSDHFPVTATVVLP